MLKRDELKGPSCLTNAAEDEPIFVLRANDELAPAAVRAWAERYTHSKGRFITPAQKAKALEALMLAKAMEDWKARILR